MTREQHLDWCKRRAHEYLAHGDVAKAVTSMLSDLNKHPETALKDFTLCMLGVLAAQNGSMTDAKRFIEGFT